MYSAGVLVRDYLLDPDPTSLSAHRNELIAKRDAVQSQVDVLFDRISPDERPVGSVADGSSGVLGLSGSDVRLDSAGESAA
jgi:hypothetical protein